MKNKVFYRAFEEKYRGSQELIQKRLEVYIPFILALKEVNEDVKALDIGCGRGEWIGLLAKHGIVCKGIDLDKGMLKACKQQKFDVEYGDGIAYLGTLEDKSLMVISAFHVVEHISFEQLQRLVEESLRVLKPGGLLIMETPNPENIKVATENFYNDPTHIKPIPARLLSFLPEFYGFAKVKVLRLQEQKDLLSKRDVSLMQVLEEASPDYAVVAQKDAKNEILEHFDGVFSKDYGLSLGVLAESFESRIRAIEAKVSEAEKELLRIKGSVSWKVTKPLRIIYGLSGRVLKVSGLSIYQKFKKLYQRVILRVQYHECDELTFEAQGIYDLFGKIYKERTLEKFSSNKLAIVTPLPPQRSGVSSYILDLLEGLSQLYEIDLISNVKPAGLNVPVYSLDYFKKHAGQYSKILYQVGNHPIHEHYLDLIEQFPGIVVLHDFFLGDLLYSNGNHERLDRGLVYSHGYSSIYQKKHRNIKEIIKKYPSNAQILQHAKAVIVHSEYAKSLSIHYYNDVYINKIFDVPQVYMKDEEDLLLDHIDERNNFLVCSFGHIVEHKCIKEIIDAWKKCGLSNEKKYQLIFVGQLPETDYGKTIESLTKELENVKITGYLSDGRYKEYLKRTDLAIQLRLESRGEASRALLECMAWGIPTIANAHGFINELPDDAIYKIAEQFTTEELSSAIKELHSNRELSEQISNKSRKYMNENHSPIIVAKRMRDIIENIYDSSGFCSIRDRYPEVWSKSGSFPTVEAAALAKSIDLELKKQQVPRVYVDISAIINEDLKTGIQRVVRAILTALFQMDLMSYHVVPVYLTDKNNYWHYRVANSYMTYLTGDKFTINYDTVVEPVEGDIYLGLDFYAGGVVEAFKSGLYHQWKKRGVDINFVVYDILPILHPHFFPDSEEVSSIHAKWVECISSISKQLVCISHSVANDLQSWLKENSSSYLKSLKITSIHLGADIDNSVPSNGLPTNTYKVLEAIKASKSFLMVGTIEPRKRHQQVLEAFEMLWERKIDVNLVIVGKKGWNIEHLIQKLYNHPYKNQKLFVLNDVSDEYLEKIYESSVCLIAASEGEGFGLPLIEAAQKKIPIIARDIPVFKEVAGKHAYYFENSKEPEVITETIKEWLDLYKEGKHPSSDDMPWLTWEESAKQLLLNLGIKK